MRSTQMEETDRFHIPDFKAVLNAWGLEAQAQLINISQGGALIEITGDRSELLMQNDPKRVLKIKEPNGYYEISNLSVRLSRLNAT